ncbi:MAG TPA: acyl-ACP--UDP-N-acetylglucosamine O-acyltransferase [Pirellulaceae bacterium]|nr:acyl-ACP--UDP-N-acetylglucosamine O-acyltransferase [Pirellulaceae bacterium]
MTQIHPTAIVDPRAEIGQDVVIGPYCIIEAGAVIGDGCRLEARAIVKSRTTLGKNNEIGEGAVLGGRAQHVQVQEPGGTLVIGDGNRIRENATIHRAWGNDSVTTVGNGCMIMINAHIGHDSRIGNHCILVNNVMIAGHVTLEDRAYLAGASAVHQFTRVGKLAMVGGMAKIKQDVPPFVLIDGSTSAEVVGLNKVGLRRSGCTAEDMFQLKAAYRVIYREGRRWSEVLEILQTDFASGPAAAFYEFLKAGKRGFVQERRISRKATLKIVDASEDEIGEDADRDAA